MSSLAIRGSKGSSSTHTPVESPDSLINTSYANILDAISEGPIVGLVNGAQSIYFDQTPLANADGSLNFTGVTWEQRTGEAEQDYISGFPAVEAETSVGIELKASQAWTQGLSNIQLSAVRIRLGASSLYQTDSDGDTGGYTVEYAVDLATDGGDYATVLSTSFVGKTTSGYQRSHRIELPKATMGWQIRVRRITADSTTSSIVATTTVISYTEVIDAKLQYPYTALVAVKVDASQFSAIPERAYRIRGRTIQVPANYDPSTRSYSGTWDGTFKIAWTDNPAWIYRDLVLNDRYGLGRYISDSQVDKWGLYQIAQYCDVLVSDGKGGTEPRFTCNLYLQSQNDALSVLQDMASIFRGMSYYAASEVVVSADMPADPVYTYTNSNVVNGKFSRAGSSGSTRYSVCKVAWSDRDNFGNVRTEYVQDQKSLARYGIRETSITAFGCASQGQAQRLGQYTILTNQLETDTISFSVGLDGTVARPGQIVRVADENFAGRPIGGRIKAATTNSVTLDSDVQVAAGDTLVIILPNGTAQTRVVRSVAGRVISVTQAFSSVPVTESIYAIETAQLVPEVYRILTVAENFGDDKLQHDIVAVQHNASKFAAIDNGAKIVYPPTTVLPNAIQAVPTNILLSTYEAVKQGLTVTTMRVTWDQAKGAASYNVWWRRDSGDWIYAGVTYTNAIEVTGIYTGTYTARVSAVGVNGNSSLWGYSDPTLLQGKAGFPPAVTSLTAASQLFGISLVWTFPEGAEDTQRTELWYSPNTSLADATKLSDLAYPQADYVMQGLQAGARFFFWARLVDRTGNSGAFYPDGNGVMGLSSSEAGPILEMLGGQVSETELSKEINDQIDLISGPAGLPGSVNSRVEEAKQAATDQVQAVSDQLDAVNGQVSAVHDSVTEINAQVAELNQQVNDIIDAAEYQADEAYAAGASTRKDGRLYQAKIAVPADTTGAKAPPNSTYWLDVGQIVSDSNGLAARVSTTESKITSIEGVNTSQGTAITGLQNSLSGKADASALDALTTRVTSSEGSLTSQGNRVTSLENSVNSTTSGLATKASTTALNSLAGRVTAAEGTLTSQSTAVTNLTAAVNGLGASGVNLLPGEYSVYSATLPTLAGTNFTATAVADAVALRGYALKLDWTTTTTTLAVHFSTGATVDGCNMSFKNQKYIVSYWAKASVSGHQVAQFFREVQADGVTLVTGPATLVTLTDAWARYSVVVDMSNSTTFTGSKMQMSFQMNRSGVANRSVWLDRIMVEPVVNGVTEPSSFVPGSSYDQSVANASATSSLDARVTAAEGVNTSQSSQIVSLGNSLTTTNSNVAAAQTAATSAATLAGSKGKVLVQADTPAVADQLAQNLWIDITGGANTPKRWNGSAWTAVTDKVATDAAAAAANALAVANTKASADSVTALTNTVTQQGNTITAQGNSLTSVQAAVGTLGASGINLLPAEYTVFGPTPPAPLTTGTFTVATEADALAMRGYALKFTSTNTTSTTVTFGAALTAAACNMSFKAQKYIVSYWAKASVAGHQIASYLRVLNADGTSFNTGPATLVTLTDTWARYSVVMDVSNAATYSGNQCQLSIQLNRSAVNGRVVWFDRIMVEPVVNNVTEPSAFVIGASYDQAVANASATSALDARVTTAEGTITSQGSSITQLTNSVASKADNSALQALTSTVTQQGSTITSQGSALTSLTSRVTDAESVNAGQASAISSIDTRVTSTEAAITAQAQRTDGLFVQITPDYTGDDDWNVGENTVYAGTVTVQSVLADATGAVSRKVDTVQAQVNDTNAAVQQVSQAQVTADGKASAMWAVKLQVNAQGQYVVAGIGAGIENVAGKLQSNIIFQADQISFASPKGDGTLTYPFIISGGVNYLNSTFIQDGTITNAKIGNYIQSNNFVAGSTGWRLYFDGTFEINSALGGGGRQVINGAGGKVFDASGVKRYQWGNLDA